ncbi:MAG TPA: hypothetical protein VHF58_05870 [Solirubrobacterales bacterium]|nr:hypothetical protein [Solirubrobacterales bacterium]
MAFPDDELDPAPSGARHGRPPGQRDIFVRRLIALGAGILILILILLGIRACLESRKERGFENYVSDVNSAARSSNELSARFFERLRTPPDRSSPTTLEAQITNDRVGAEANLQQVEAVDTPDELADAQSDLVRAFQLRRDAISSISQQIPTALGDEGRTEAIAQISVDMRTLLATDVLYAQAQAEIDSVLQEEGIDARLESSVFLPEPVESWLNDFQLTSTLNAFAASARNCAGETRGVEMSTVTVNGTELVDGGENLIESDQPIQIEADVINGGTTADEVDVAVNAEISGQGGVLEGTGSIPRISPGLAREATIQIDAEPPRDTPLTIEVSAPPVPCEALLDNNSLSYTITFE